MRTLWVLMIISLSVLTTKAQENVALKTDVYKKLVVSGSVAVEIISSGEGNIVFDSDESEENIEVLIKKDVLQIKGKTDLKEAQAYKLSLHLAGELEEISVSKGVKLLNRDTLKAENIAIQAKSGSKIELSINVASLDVNVTHGSNVILYGKTTSQNVQVSAWGNYAAYDLESRDSYVKATSGGQAKVIAHRIIEATSNGPSFVGYIGEPESTYMKSSLGGEIVHFKNRKAADDN